MPRAELPPDAIVIRFRPTDPEAVLGWAQKEHRRRRDPARPDETFYRISCFADVKHGDEDTDAVVRRLVEAAQLSGLDLSKNRNCWVSISGELHDAEVTFWKDGDTDEVPEHYSLDIGTSPSVERVVEILDKFQGPERTAG